VTAVEVTTTGDLRITVGSLADAEVRLPRALAASGARVVTMAPDSVDLEDVFLELTS
jgi:hypothetical protein